MEVAPPATKLPQPQVSMGGIENSSWVSRGHVIPKKNATTNNHVDESKAGTPFGFSTFLQGLG